MYIHIGGEYSISDKMIIGIFDFDEILTCNDDSLNFIKKCERENKVENISFDIPRSIIIAKDRVYISPISTRTIRKRMYDQLI